MTRVLSRRMVAAGLFGIVVLGGAVTDRLVGRGPGAALLSSDRSAIGPTAAESTSWFCPSGTGTGGPAPSTLLLTNPTNRPVTGTVTAVPEGGAPRQVPISVPSGGQASVVPAQLASGPEVAATVALAGGGVAVTESVAGPTGWADGACASRSAGRWLFPDASTASGDTATLALYNPGSTSAVVDVTLATSGSGLVAPPDYQEITVAPLSLVTENLGDHVPDDPAVAAVVSTLSGTVVAGELQSFGSPAHGGLALQLGQPAGDSWSFAQSTQNDGSSNVYTVFDPGLQPARVTVTLGLQRGFAEPYVLEVPAGGKATFSTAGQTRVPVGAAFAARFTSAEGIPVVVSRRVTAPAAAPAPQVGEAVGQPGGARRWLIPSVPPPGTSPWSLAVSDVAGWPVSVTVSTVAAGHPTPVEGLISIRVVPGTPAMIGPTPPPPAAALLVTATGPITVELDAVPVGTPGVVVVPALPLH